MNTSQKHFTAQHLHPKSWLCAWLLAAGMAAALPRVDIAAEEYTFTTLAGLAGQSGSADGTGSAARFFEPRGVAVDGGGTVYVADSWNLTIRKITPKGVVTTLAGSAGQCCSGADGTGSAARFYAPFGVAVDGAGTVYVADSFNHTIRKITPEGVVTTLAGLAKQSGSADGTGSAARFNYPCGVAVDGTGTVYVADSGNDTIRKITPEGVVATLAGLAKQSGSADGTGGAARFDYPCGVAVDGTGAVYVADYDNYTIRKITPDGVVTTLAGLAGQSGSADETGSAARFYAPWGVAVDGTGAVYVADTYNHTIRVGMVAASGGSFSWELSQVITNESASDIVLAVRRQGSNTAPASVEYFTTSGTAQAGTDFIAANGVLTFASGQTSQTVTIRLIDDFLLEAPESFSVELRNPSANWRLGNPAFVTVTLIDDDPPSPIDLGEALGPDALNWVNGGEANWAAAGDVGFDGGPGGQSGELWGQGQTSWLQTTVSGPGSLSYWWKVSCQSSYVEENGGTNTGTGYWSSDYATFSVNGVEWERREGESDWEQRTWSLPAGPHTLRWTYVKNSDGSATGGQGRMWIDEVAFTITGLWLASPGSAVDGRFRFELQAPAGTNYVIQASSNLTTWEPITTNTLPTNGVVTITDPASTNLPRRFYRVVQPQP